jgi:small subunit ribosomal protein S16
MALKIRLSRGGAKKRPFYSIVVADSRSPRDGRFIEKLGTYNPMLEKGNKDRVVLKTERIQHWIKMGALPSDRVTLFLADVGMTKRPEIRETPLRSMPRAERKKLEALKAEPAIPGAPPAAAAEGGKTESKPAEKKDEKKAEKPAPAAEGSKAEAKPAQQAGA